jgi:hypothetical protein
MTGVNSCRRSTHENGAGDEVLKVPLGREQSLPIRKLIVGRRHAGIVTRLCFSR